MIRLGKNFRLDNDDRCYILQERKIVQNGENKGAERYMPPDYSVLPGASTAPVGSVWISNKESYFGYKRKNALLLESCIVGYVWWSDCAGLDDRDVLAWRELPEPWEGVSEQCENG